MPFPSRVPFRTCDLKSTRHLQHLQQFFNSTNRVQLHRRFPITLHMQHLISNISTVKLSNRRLTTVHTASSPGLLKPLHGRPMSPSSTNSPSKPLPEHNPFPDISPRVLSRQYTVRRDPGPNNDDKYLSDLRFASVSGGLGWLLANFPQDDGFMHWPLGFPRDLGYAASKYTTAGTILKTDLMLWHVAKIDASNGSRLHRVPGRGPWLVAPIQQVCGRVEPEPGVDADRRAHSTRVGAWRCGGPRCSDGTECGGDAPCGSGRRRQEKAARSEARSGAFGATGPECRNVLRGEQRGCCTQNGVRSWPCADPSPQPRRRVWWPLWATSTPSSSKTAS